jgi:hypothetical protein
VTIVPTIRYTVKTRLYEIVELIVLDDGESCIGDVIEVAGHTYGEACRCYRRVMR